MKALRIETSKRHLYLFLAMFMLFSVLVNPFMCTENRELRISRVHAKDMWDDFNVEIDEKGPKVSGTQDSKSAWKTVIDKYKYFISGFAGVGAVTMVALFIKNFISLGASSGNPNARSQALTGCLWTGIAAAGLGAVSLITGVFYKLLV